jgi:hypothetical protein
MQRLFQTSNVLGIPRPAPNSTKIASDVKSSAFLKFPIKDDYKYDTKMYQYG